MENIEHKSQERDLYGMNAYKPIEEEILLRPISRKLAQVLKNTRIDPNHISFLGFILTLFISIYIYAYEQSLSLYLVVIGLYVINVLDKLDGDLARIQNKAGRKGQYIDGFLDCIGDIVLISVWIHSSNGPGSGIWSGLSVGAIMLFYYHSISAPFYLDILPKTHSGEKTSSWKTLFYWGRAKFFLLLIISLLVQKPQVVGYILPLIGLYTISIFLKNIIKGLTKR